MVEIVPKKISYNKTLIDDLMKNMLQDYIKMATNQFFPDRIWGDIVESILECELAKPYPARAYKDMKRNMDFVGKKEYSPKLLDVTAATCLLIQNEQDLGFPKGKTKSIKSCLYSLRDDRNEMPGHSNANENEYELFEWGVVTLGHMDRFLRVVYECELFENESKEKFKHEYRNRIKQAKLCLEIDYRTHLLRENEESEFDELLKKVLSSNDPTAFHDVGRSFLDSRSPRKDIKKYIDWIRKAANGGIDSAQETLGDWYYTGEKAVGVEKDWTEALKWYEAVDKRSPIVEVRIASLYANGISPTHSVEEGMELIESYKSQWNIQVTELEDGTVDYRWHPKQKAQNDYPTQGFSK